MSSSDIKLDPAKAASDQTAPTGSPWSRNCGFETGGLLGCIHDPCTSCAVFFFPCVTASQLYERTTGSKGICIKLTAILAAFIVFAQLFDLMHVRLSSSVTQMSIWSYLGDLSALAYAVMMLVLVITVRQRVRRHDRCDTGGIESTRPNVIRLPNACARCSQARTSMLRPTGGLLLLLLVPAVHAVPASAAVGSRRRQVLAVLADG